MVLSEGKPIRLDVLGPPKPEPTLQDIAEGRVAVGMTAFEKQQLAETMKDTLLRERAANRAAVKKARREAYEEAVKDQLEAIAGIEARLIDITAKLTETGAISKEDLDTVKLGIKVAENVKDRALGKAVRRQETMVQGGFLHALVQLHEGNQGGE